MFSRIVPPPWLLSLLVVVSGLGRSLSVHAHDVPAEMRQAADRFLQSLSRTERQIVQVPFASDRRRAWHYLPSSMLAAHGGRRGLEIKRMSALQRGFALGLLNTALSHRGQLQATTVMALETILGDIEDGNPARDSELYHVAIYGAPSEKETWGWSFEGHHLSVNLMLIDGTRFSLTPSFWGSNPAIVKAGPFRGLDALALEQRLARELARSLSDVQKQKAIIALRAPRDILTAAQQKVDKNTFQPPQGIAFEELDPSQQRQLLRLVRQYADKYRQQIIDRISQRTPIVDGQGMFFAWAGGVMPGDGHYYRIQTPHFLFEYDNTQNDANHIHTVWRSFDGDFGEDLLRQHYENSPHHGATDE